MFRVASLFNTIIFLCKQFLHSLILLQPIYAKWGLFEPIQWNDLFSCRTGKIQPIAMWKWDEGTHICTWLCESFKELHGFAKHWSM